MSALYDGVSPFRAWYTDMHCVPWSLISDIISWMKAADNTSSSIHNSLLMMRW